MAEALGNIPSLDDSFGALLIGVLISGFLCGIATAQMYWYYLTYPKDNLGIKILVAWAWTWDFVQQIMLSHFIYFFLITNYFNPSKLDYHVWSLNWQVLPETVACATVQGYYTYRIWRSTRSKYRISLIIFPVLLIVAKFALGITYCVMGIPTKSITVALDYLHPISLSLNALAAAADITIAVTMSLVLRNMRGGYENVNNVVQRLIIFTVNTGAITAGAALATFIVQISLRGNPTYGAVYFVTSKLYVNTMLASLNSREKMAYTLRSSQYQATASPTISGQFSTEVNTAVSTPHKTEFSDNLATGDIADANRRSPSPEPLV